MAGNPDNLHTFVVCAYKDSEYLEPLIDSLLAQSARSGILISTSTPADSIYKTAAKYGLSVSVNPDGGSIGADWSFAYTLADTDLVTLAHQDDIYEPDYTEKVLAAYAKAKNPILIYTNYYEIRPEGRVTKNRLLKVKALMNAPIRAFPKSRFVRNRVFSMGCPILCPSVAYNKKRFPDFAFARDMKTNLDWDAWYRLAKEPGEFLYIRDRLVGHRIHEGSETSGGIATGARTAEDLEMFRRYWPEGCARLIHRFYSKGLESNRTD